MIGRIAWNRIRRGRHQLRMAFRAIRLRSRKPFLRQDSTRPEAPGKILAIRTDRLGDMILTLPAIDALAAAYPGALLQVAGRPHLLPLLRERHGVDGVLPVSAEDTVETLSRKIADLEPDMVVDFSAPQDLLAVRSACRAGVPVRVGFSGGGREVYLTDPVRPPKGRRSLGEENRLLVHRVGAESVPSRPRVPVPEAERRSAETFLRQCGAGPGAVRIALHPGGRYPTQRLANEQWAAACRMLQVGHGDFRFILLGGPADLDRIDALAGLIGSGAMIMPPMDLFRLAAVLSACDLLLCNNSGPLHLASAVETPTLSVTGPTDPVRFHPQGVFQEVLRIRDLPCSPCGRGGCASHECMKRIDPGEIAAVAKRLLSSAADRGRQPEEGTGT